jgi:hypothetical protein
LSNALAIASVTAVLKDLLNNGLIDHNLASSVGDVTVSALAPDRIDVTETKETSRLNLFLYRVTPNQGWRNAGLPSRDAAGERLTNPPLALDLHYLLTAYGAAELHAEILLGYGMQLLHETPVLARAAIRRSLAPPSAVTPGGGLPPALEALFTSELAEQFEQIRITPQPLTTEEISKLWAAFQTKYRPTAAYQVSAVLIESRRATRPALPVRARGVHVVPFKRPVIERIMSRENAAAPAVADQPILAGHILVIEGVDLRGDITRVNVGGSEEKPDAADVADTQISVTLPPTLRAGVQGVQVIQRVLLGSPLAEHRGFESNVAAFVLRPRIEAVSVSQLQGAGAEPRAANIDLSLAPEVGVAQRVVLMLNELIAPPSPPGSPEAAPRAYSFVAPPRIQPSPPTSPPTSSASITVPVTGVRPGRYLVRVQVDGAESPLGADASGRFDSPQVLIP